MQLTRVAPVVVGIGLVAATLLGLNPGGERCSFAQAQSDVATSGSVASSSRIARRIHAEGRVATYAGAEVQVGTDTAGIVSRVLVEERSRVTAGDVIVELESSIPRAAVNEARARLGELDADLRLHELEVARYERLEDQSAASQQDVDRARHALEAARARRALAEAQVAQAEAVLARTRITAPISGTVTMRVVHPGEAVPAGARLVTVVDLARTRVCAEVDEFDLGNLHVGAEVTITAEGFPGRKWKGRVEEIPDAVVARALRPMDPGRPSDTRVVQAKVALLEATPLKLGQRVEVDIDE